MTFRVSPGVYSQTVNLAIDAPYVNPSIGASVFGAPRGPLGPQFLSSRADIRRKFGKSDPNWGFGVDSMNFFMLEATSFWGNRVVSADAKYAMGLFANNKIANVAAGTSFTPIPAGSVQDYKTTNKSVKDVEISADFATDHSITVTINTVATSAVTFSVSHSDTMQRLKQAIHTVLDGLGTGGSVSIITTSGNVQRLLRIVSPQAISLDVSATITGSAAPTATVRDADWLCFVLSENPGAWGSGVAVGIQNVDVGIKQKLKFSISDAIVTLNVITIIINGVTVTTAYNTSNNVTLANLCTAFTAAFPGGAAEVVSTGTANDRQVIFTAPSSEVDLVVSAANVTLGASQATISYAETLKSSKSTKAFNFNVYENAAFRQPDESWRVTYAQGSDGLGNQTEMAFTVNEGPSKSALVRVYMNPLFSGVVNAATPVTDSNYPRYLSGGDNGSLPTTGDIVTGWQSFADPEKYTVRILINSGYSTPEVHQAMTNLCEARNDCFAVLDIPSNKQQPADAVSYRNFESNLDSRFAALYSPDILIFDPDMGMRRYVPPSGLVAAQYAYTDRVTREWFAPAGLNRGIIKNALGVRVLYGEGDRDLLSAAQVNAIRHYAGRYPIWGEYTTARALSPLQSVPVCRLLIAVQTAAADVVAYSVFEPNDPFLWHQIRSKLGDLLRPIQRERGISEYRIQCDEKNNTPDIVDQRVVKAAMWIKPALAALYIRLTSVITKQSADFDIEMVNANGMY